MSDVVSLEKVIYAESIGSLSASTGVMYGIPNPRFFIMERREKVYGMLSQGLNESEIAKQLSVGQSTICRDIKSIKKDSLNKIRVIVDDILPFEFGKSLLSLNHITKNCWMIIKDDSGKWTNKDKINAMKLVKDIEVSRFEILKNGPLNLEVIHLREQLEELKEDQDTSRIKGFMPALLHNNLEDLK